MSLGWCHNRLAISGSIGVDVAQLAEEGITHVINCRRDPDYEKRLLEVHKGVVVLWNPTDDDGERKDSEWFHESILFALEVLVNPRHKILVSCCHGNNRAPSTALAILMAQGFSFPAALNMVLDARPGANVRYREDARLAVKLLGYV